MYSVLYQSVKGPFDVAAQPTQDVGMQTKVWTIRLAGDALLLEKEADLVSV
jgi:hypothetical protein